MFIRIKHFVYSLSATTIVMINYEHIIFSLNGVQVAHNGKFLPGS